MKNTTGATAKTTAMRKPHIAGAAQQPHRNDDQAPILSAAVTFAIVAGSSLLFCSKGVFVKSAFQLGTDPLTLLTLRMVLAMPIFLVALWITERNASVAIDRRVVWKLIGLGFIGYYLSSIVNFTGLQFVSVGLERMVLYTYPTLVVIGSVVFFRTRLRSPVVAAIILTYAGIGIAWHGEASAVAAPSQTILGVALVFLSALTYAAFMLMSGRMVRDIGGIRFTSYVVAISGGFMIFHYLCLRSPIELLTTSPPVLMHGFILAVFGTALPSFLLGIGLARAGAQKFAIISTVGPVGTVLMAWLALGESMSAASITGFAMTMTGGVAVTLMKE